MIFAQFNVRAWNEEQMSNLGNVITFHSAKQEHSSYHYDLIKMLALKCGFSPDTAETIARYSVLVDQINPKPNYPYPNALNNISLPDTVPGWNESIAGTERGNPSQSSLFSESVSVYWHFPLRDPADTITGPMVYGSYPSVSSIIFRQYPYYWRVPFVLYLSNIKNWAIYGTGDPGAPDNGTPVLVKYYDVALNTYRPVQPGSLQAFAIFLHALGDSYSHEECSVLDTLRNHPVGHEFCGLNYHTDFEYPYYFPIYTRPHSEGSVQATWRAMKEYKRVKGISAPLKWLADTNGIQDGDGIPDELEETNSINHDATFMEKWKSPASVDLNGDSIIDNSDHTTHRIMLCNLETNTLTQMNLRQGWNLASLNVVPVYPQMDSVLSEVKTNKLVLAKNATDGFYSPFFEIYSLNNWAVKQALYIYLTRPHCLLVKGNSIEPQNDPIALQAGWNWVPYLRQSAQKVQICLGSIATVLLAVKNDSGESYIPRLGINTLEQGTIQVGKMLPGKGYMIYVTQATTLVYPSN